MQDIIQLIQCKDVANLIAQFIEKEKSCQRDEKKRLKQSKFGQTQFLPNYEIRRFEKLIKTKTKVLCRKCGNNKFTLNK